MENNTLNLKNISDCIDLKTVGELVDIEAIEEFTAHYVPLIHTEVFDEVFQAPYKPSKKLRGLTAIKLATETIQRFLYDSIKKAIQENNEEVLLELLKYTFYIVVDVIGVKCGSEWKEDGALGFSYGNNKLGKRIITFNTSPAFLCPSMACGFCKQCKNCYAYCSEIRHDYELSRNILNNIKLLYYDVDTIINDTIKHLGHGEKTLTSEFVRFNQNGDILNDNMLLKCNKLALELKTEYMNILSIYTYTHNKMLNTQKANDIVFNHSDKDNEVSKGTIVLYKWDDKYFDTSKYILCLGNCSDCPYCKNKDEKRTVIFMAHGGGLKAIKTVPDYVIQTYSNLLYWDNVNFMNQARLEKFTSNPAFILVDGD